MEQLGISKEKCDNIIINEYRPGNDFIGPHIDVPEWFGDTIKSLSLGTDAMMTFTHTKSGEKRYAWLHPRSVLTLKGESRYDWTHEIEREDILPIGNDRRYSITFRTVNLELYKSQAISFVRSCMPGVFSDEESAWEFAKCVNPAL